MKVSVGVAAAAGSLLVGCASLPADRGSGDVAKLVAARTAALPDVQWDQGGVGRVRESVGAALSQPLDADAAVRVALSASPRVRMLYSELGFAQADVYDASRLSNPSIGFERLSANGGGAKTTWSISQGFTELLFARYRSHMGQLALLSAQQRVAHEVLSLEADVRGAWQAHAAARLSAQLWSGAAHAAQVSADLAGRFHEAGNISELQLAREQAAASAALIAARQSEVEVDRSRARLLSLMGVEDGQIALLDTLSLPVPLGTDLKSLQAIAQKQRLDLQSFATGITAAARQERQVTRWRWISAVTVGLSRERDVDGSTLKGGGISLELPLFNSGGGRLLRATASREFAQSGLDAARLDVAADVAVQFAALKAAERNVAEYRERLLPLQQRIVELTQQRQNYMLIGALELIEARRLEIGAWQAYVESLRDYALARTELARAVGGNLPAGEAPVQAAQIPEFPMVEQTGDDR
jgi:outer membrane protein, heavy metal efflux system